MTARCRARDDQVTVDIPPAPLSGEMPATTLPATRPTTLRHPPAYESQWAVKGLSALLVAGACFVILISLRKRRSLRI